MKYKNPFEDPEAKLWDKKIKDYKIPKRRKVPPKEKAKFLLTKDLEDYIYIPKIKLYVAKKTSLHNLNWYDTHKELHKRGLQMLTPRQFIDFVLYLKRSHSIPDAKKILDEIFTVEKFWRGFTIREWLDAEFKIKKNYKRFSKGTRLPTRSLYMNYNHRTTDGKLVTRNTESLEKCLMKDCCIDLESCNRQGLPTQTGKNNILYSHPYYFYPRRNRVAAFATTAYPRKRAYLECDWNGKYADSAVGVRPAFRLKKLKKR